MDWLDLLAVQGDSQESSPTPQFKSINSLALLFLYRKKAGVGRGKEMIQFTLQSGKPGVLQPMGSQRAGHSLAIEQQNVKGLTGPSRENGSEGLGVQEWDPFNRKF